MADYVVTNDVSEGLKKAYNTSNGRYHDVKFRMEDGSELGATKFLLASQSMYFDKMFYGGLKHEDEIVPLEWCKSKCFKKILDFISFGKTKISELKLLELLELLEATRLMCIDRLFEETEKYVLNSVLNDKKEDLICQHVLEAFNYTVANHLEKVQQLLLVFIDQNLMKLLNELEAKELGALSCSAMVAILEYGGKAPKKHLLTLFVSWQLLSDQNQIDVSQWITLDMLEINELKQARQFDIFSKTDIMDQYEKMIVNLQGEMDHCEKNNKKNDDLFKQEIYKLEGNLVLNESNNKRLENNNKILHNNNAILENEIRACKAEIAAKNELIAEMTEIIETRPVTLFCQ